MGTYERRMVGLTIGIVIVTAIYASFAAGQWCAIREANRLTVAREKIELRPYISLGNSEGVFAPQEKGLLNNGGQISGYLNFYNSGQTPANEFAVSLDSKNFTYRERWEASPAKIDTGTKLDISTRVIAAHNSITYLVKHPGEFVNQTPGQYPTIEGSFEFCDVFGNYDCAGFVLTVIGNTGP
ncbi:MAG TPA: hypothetical protein VMT64_02085, partial [Candidatus Binataceae bacterium]|nr:hypothetical protein [Candidatus Binataceae bacterium]